MSAETPAAAKPPRDDDPARLRQLPPPLPPPLPPARAGVPGEAPGTDETAGETNGDYWISPPPLFGRVWAAAASVVHWLFGMVCVLIGLAVTAAIPVLQLLSFGYLLEVAGRIARQRRLRSGFVGLDKAARIGALVACTWLLLLPLRLVTDQWHDAQLLDPSSPQARGLGTATAVLTVLTLAHILTAWYAGGRVRYFFWPLLFPWFVLRMLFGSLRWSDWLPPARLWTGLRRGGVYAEVRDGLWDFVTALRLPYLMWLGAWGTVGALVWLAAPVVLLIGGASLPPGAAAWSGLLGAVTLGFVAMHLPFIEARFAAEQRWQALFELRPVRQAFARAPVAFWLALFFTLALSLPLHLLETLPPLIPELCWAPALFFAVCLFPARLLSGWALARAANREDPRFFLFRWLSRLTAVPVVLFYALVIYLSQYTNFYGSWRLFEQPAFLLPAPFWLGP